MSYTKTTNFSVKDTLPSGDENKIVKGSEINTEFNNIETAMATLNSAISGLGTTTISSFSATKVTVAGGAYSSYYTAPNPGFVILWYHGTANISGASNGAQTRVLNLNTYTEVNGPTYNIADTLYVVSVGLGTS